MDRQKVESCLRQVTAYRASGLKAKEWAAANGVALGMLQSWCTHAGRWQARLDGVRPEASPGARPSGFVAARVDPGTTSASVRVALNAGATRVDLHWPVAHTRELAALLRELGR